MPPFVASNFSTPVSVVAVPVAKGILIKTTIEAGYTDDDTITLPELIYKLHHKVNGLPYVALVDDNTVRQRGLRMGSPFDLLPYTDDKAMEMLTAQWEYHDPGNTYWPTAEQCFTRMTVGRIHHSIRIHNSSTSYDFDPSDYCDLKITARSNDDRKQHLTELKTASRARGFEQETTAVIELSLASNQDNNALYHLDAESEKQRLFEIQVEEATNRSLKEARDAPPSYDDLYNYVRSPPSDSSSTVVGSSTC